MNRSRRQFIAGAAAVGTITVLPFDGRADAHAFATPAGEITVHPVSHASFVLNTPMGAIYVDTVGDPGAYADLPPADMILITHRHGDHYNADTLAAIAGSAPIYTCRDVLDMMPDGLKANARAVDHGATEPWRSLGIGSIPAYNLSADRQNFHPRERGDNGFVLTFDNSYNFFRVYVSGDTEDIPEMRRLQDIDLAFVCMNLPFTMTSEAAASAVAEFKPKFVYPYHYRGRDGGTQDPKAFAAAVGGAAEVKLVDWYPDDDSL